MSPDVHTTHYVYGKVFLYNKFRKKEPEEVTTVFGSEITLALSQCLKK